MPSRIARGNLIFVCLLLLAAGLLAAIILVDHKSGLNCTYTFNDAKDLAPGAAVKMHGVQIGEVTGISIADQLQDSVHVNVRIYPEHRKLIYAPPNSSARIKKDSMVLGSAYVDIINRGQPNGETMQTGTVVKGLDGWAEEKLWVGKDKLSSSYTKALELGAEGINRVEEWARSDDGQKLKAQVNDFLESLEDASAAKAQQAREKLGDALEKGTKLMNQIRDQADNQSEQTADDLQKSLQEMLDQAKDLDDVTRAKLQAALKNAQEQAQKKMKDLQEKMPTPAGS